VLILLALVRRQLIEAARRLSRGGRGRVYARLAHARSLLVVLALTGVGVAGCGGVAGDAVVQVNGSAITSATLEHWMRVAAAATSAAGNGKTVLPQPPGYAACIANLRAAAPKPAKGQAPPTSAVLRSECAQRYTALKTEALGYLISAEWLIQEAGARHVAVSDQQVHRRFIKLRSANFTTAASFEGFLRRSGLSVSDVLLRIKLEMLGEGLEQKVLQGGAAVTHADVAKYYREHRSQFARQSLAQATAAIEQQLSASRRAQRFATFKAAYQSRWRSRTSCRAGFVVAECEQYRAPAPNGGGAKG
jgi:hypothetical protein